MNIYIALTLLWTTVVLFATLSPGDQIPGNILFDLPYADKIIHTGLFTIQGFLMIKMFQGIKGLDNLGKWRLWITLLLGAILGVFVEFMQHFIPDRSFEMTDLACNIFGISLGLVTYVMLNKIYG